MCILCQEDTGEKLQCPATSRRPDFGMGYERMAENIEGFFSIDSLPFDIQRGQLDDGSGIKNTFLKNKASWHISCKDKVNSTKLARATKKQKTSEKQTETPKKTRRLSNNGRKRTDEDRCFFCNGLAGNQGLHRASTLEVDKKVRESAKRLERHDLLAKLSAGDMVALDALYHAKCLSALYNEVRTLEKTLDSTMNSQSYLHGLAFASLVSHVEDYRESSDIAAVFKLADLVKLYSARLHDLGMPDSDIRVNSTRLKGRLLESIPGLCAYSQGKHVLLAFNDVIGDALHQACEYGYDSEALFMARAAKIVRRDLNTVYQTFQGTFQVDCQKNAVPASLLALIEMIIEGPSKMQSGKTEEDANIRAATLTIAQLLMFNIAKQGKGKKHSKDRECPLPIYTALKIHGETRKRTLVDAFYKLGLCISYDLVLEISTDLANSVTSRFEHGVVCPPQLCKTLFTTAGIDNIDHNPSSTTSSDSFHGTAISLVQNPSQEHQGINRRITEEDFLRQKQRTIGELPLNYSNVPPAVLRVSDAIPPNLPNSTILNSIVAGADTRNENEFEWLNTVRQYVSKEIQEKDEYVSWAAFHASKQPPIMHLPAIISLLPMFQEQAHSISMILHAMNVVKQAVNVVNKGQPPVIALDQPLYALAKQIQWNWPSTHGEDKFLVMLGTLHVEMACLNVLGNWLDISGWTAALEVSEIASHGVADSFLKASHITRTRRAHQITAASLFILQSEAYNSYLEGLACDEEKLIFSDWVDKMSISHPQFQYWNQVLSLELSVLQLVHSIREGNFALYKTSLSLLVPWMFAMDHVNYARWLSVHIRDMQALSSVLPEVDEEFKKGCFVVHKTKNPFSAIALDHAHEQENAVVKGEGDAVGLTGNPGVLKRWMIAGPKIARVIHEFEASIGDRSKTVKRHHEQNPASQKSFNSDVLALVSAFEEFGNPFEEDSKDLIALDSKEILEEEVVKSVKNARAIGINQYKSFVKERFGNQNTKPITDTIKKNRLPLFKAKSHKIVSKDKERVSALKRDCSLFSRLYIACQSRNGNLEEFFTYENQPEPPALSERGKLRGGNKSDLLKCLEKLVEGTTERPRVDAIIMHGAVLVQMLKPVMIQTFKEYSDKVFMPHVLRNLESVERIDVVWDVYLENSLKSSARERRGSGTRVRVEANAKIPKNWQSFLRVDENKNALFRFLARELGAVTLEGKQIYTTYDQLVLSSPSTDTTALECTHEEADTRLMLHTYHASRSGCRRVLIRTVDTDVVVLAVSKQQDFAAAETWIAFGTGKHFRYIPVHNIADKLGAQRCKALLTFHAITGCDTVSFLSSKGKTTAWYVWNVFPQITDTFAVLAATPNEISDEQMEVLERFVILQYSRTTSKTKVNQVRQELFVKGNRSLENIPPTQGAFIQHTKRAVYQAGHVWGNSLIAKPVLPSPSEWGWTSSSRGWIPLWTVLPQAQEMCYELLRCGCKKGCRGRCKCVKANLVCTALCYCGGDCDREM